MCRCVRGILRRSAWVVAALTIALSSATPSNAGTLTIDFNLSGSTLALGPVNVANGMGGTVTGMARLVLTGVNAAGMITGAMSNGTISGLAVNFAVNAPLLAGVDANLVGPISITQMGSAAGGFSAGVLSLATNSFNTALAVNLNCVGTLCAAIAAGAGLTFPIVQNAMISNNMAPFAVNLASLGANATLNAAVATMNAGQAVTLTFNGREAARTFDAPEPTEAGLLVLSVLALCGVAALRRRQTA